MILFKIKFSRYL